jgi:hypothetical protein
MSLNKPQTWHGWFYNSAVGFESVYLNRCVKSATKSSKFDMFAFSFSGSHTLPQPTTGSIKRLS